MDESGIAIGSKTAIEPISEDPALGTQIVILAATVGTDPADGDGRLAGNPVPKLDRVFEIGTDVNHHAAKLVPHYHRGAYRVVYGVVVDVDVRSADTGGLDLNFDLIGSQRRLLHIPVIDETVATRVFDDPLQKLPTTDPRRP